MCDTRRTSCDTRACDTKACDTETLCVCKRKRTLSGGCNRLLKVLFFLLLSLLAHQRHTSVPHALVSHEVLLTLLDQSNKRKLLLDRQADGSRDIRLDLQPLCGYHHRTCLADLVVVGVH